MRLLRSSRVTPNCAPSRRICWHRATPRRRGASRRRASGSSREQSASARPLRRLCGSQAQTSAHPPKGPRRRRGCNGRRLSGKEFGLYRVDKCVLAAACGPGHLNDRYGRLDAQARFRPAPPCRLLTRSPRSEALRDSLGVKQQRALAKTGRPAPSCWGRRLAYAIVHAAAPALLPAWGQPLGPGEHDWGTSLGNNLTPRRRKTVFTGKHSVGGEGIEPPTSCL